MLSLGRAAAKAMPSQNSGWAEWTNFTWHGLDLYDIGHQKSKILSLPQLRGRSWGCNIGTAGSLGMFWINSLLVPNSVPWTSMEVSNPRGFFGGKPLGRWLHVDEIPCKAYGSDRFWWRGQPASQFSPFFNASICGTFFFLANHMTVVALASNLASLLSLFGSKSLSMRTRICMPHVTWCLKKRCYLTREGHVVKKVGESVKVKKEIPLSNSCCRCQAETEG